MTLTEEIEQGIKELLVITPMIKDLHNDVNNQLLFFKYNIIPIDKSKYNSGYDSILNSLKEKGFDILIA
jgi:hypothetical protein